MINADMRLYNYFTIGSMDEYGQPQTPDFTDPKGQIKMAINITSQSVQDNVNYKDCNYVGLTPSLLDDTYIIEYGNEKLKVLYVNTRGRLNQAFMKLYE